MLLLPEDIAEATRATSGKFSPAMFIDVFSDTGPMDEVSSTSRWLGTNDAAVGNDVDVDATRRRGAMVLAGGTTVAAAAAGSNTLITTLTAVIRRTDRFHYKGTLGKLGGSSYAYDGTDYAVITNDTSRFQTFTVTSTQVINEIIVAAQFTGTQAMPCTVRIVNAISGNQVGKTVSFTPNASVTRHALSGFAAGVVNGRAYKLEVVATVPSVIGSMPSNSAVVDYTCNVLLYAYDFTDVSWSIYMGSGLYWATGGQPNYKTTGYFERSLDVGSVPTDYGVLSISDVIPSGTTMSIGAYFTDSAVIAAETALTNWTLFSSVIASGTGIPAHRYWRFTVTMTSNVSQALSPELHSFAIRYIPEPTTLGTTAERKELQLYNGLALPLQLPISWTTSVRLLQNGYKALNTVSAASASLSPQFNGSMIGSVNAQIAPEPVVHDLVNKYLRGKRVDVRAGYVGISDTLHLYSGAISDLSFKNNMYSLAIEDQFKTADVSIPAEKAGDEWSAAATYSVNDVVVYGSNSYICIVAVGPVATTPDADPTHWDDNGTVWATIDYTITTSPDSPDNWHACDVITDILTNQINIPSEQVDFSAIATLKAAYPDVRVTRQITKPTNATALLGELAWLVSAQFVVREGLFSLVEDAASGATPDENIGPNDLAPNSVRYRRGWKEMMNQGVIITGYTGDGDGSDKFTKGEVLVDVTSQTNYDATVQKKWEDKWNVDPVELQTRLTDILAKYSDGRRVFGCTTTIRLLAVEPGDVVTLSSGQLPAGDAGPHSCMVISKKLDFAKQSITFEMLEV